MDWLFPITGYSFFDVWTLVHLAFWLFIGSCLWALKAEIYVALPLCMAVAFGWELFEHFVTFKYWGHLWLDPESWWNSWISDPLTCLVGIYAIYMLLIHRIRRSMR